MSKAGDYCMVDVGGPISARNGRFAAPRAAGYFEAEVGGSISSRNDLNRDTIMRIMTMANGKAAMMDAVCNPFKPPDHRSTAAARD